MIVTRSNFEASLYALKAAGKLSLDCETSGLRAHHGDRIFSVIMNDGKQSYYFNFQEYEGLEPNKVLPPGCLQRLQEVLGDSSKLFFLHNAQFDMAMLAREGLSIAGAIHCTKAMARVEYNEHLNYDLASCAERIGFKKDDTVEKYIDEQGLWEWTVVPGKKQRKKNKFFQRVPFDIIAPYGEIDADITYRLGVSQETSFNSVEVAQEKNGLDLRSRQSHLVANERKLTKVVFNMEERGVLIDIPYTKRARDYEFDRGQKLIAAFKKETGRDFMASSKLFQEVFASEKDKWAYTEKGNPSFEGDQLKVFTNPAAKLILEFRDAKSRYDFYSGFLYHADSNGVVHPNFSPDGTRTGRFSSSDPNLQNLSSEEGDEEKEFLVRRAIIPRPGYLFIMPDYEAMEYRLLIDLAGEVELAKKVLGGLDVHTATAEMMGVTRSQAKTLNFMLLYGGGAQKLADALKIPLDEARALKSKYFSALPMVQKFIQGVQEAVVNRGFLRMWSGRRAYFPNKDYAYTGPNTLIQGGTADVNKFALVAIDEYLATKKSKLVLTIHDENPIEVHEDEVDEVPKEIKHIMESVYPFKHLPLTAGMEWSRKSLADKQKGFPGAS